MSKTKKVCSTEHKVLLAHGYPLPVFRPRLAGGFDVQVVQIGSTAHVTVYIDQALDQAQATALANTVLNQAEAAYLHNASYFGPQLQSKAVNLIIAKLSPASDGTGGAYHYGCDLTAGGTLYCDADFSDPVTTIGLFIAELDEAFQGDPSNPNQGWGCGYSNGEAHSRVAAFLASGGPRGSLAPYTTGPAWDQAGRPDFVTKTEQTDRNPVSTGCGMIFIDWLMSLGYSFTQITQAAADTLAGVYQNLTGKTTALHDFTDALAGVEIQDDDPFHAYGNAVASTQEDGQIVVDIAKKTVHLPRGWTVISRT
ncbi:MAG TPA: hypothetical protein VFA18_08880 [Gemmataceae bacterium]|nr:hypothetical protein [Gemmataceae bacterium]